LASFIIGFAIAPFSAKTDLLTSAASQREGETES